MPTVRHKACSLGTADLNTQSRDGAVILPLGSAQVEALVRCCCGAQDGAAPRVVRAWASTPTWADPCVK